jgi:hypothetical protein
MIIAPGNQQFPVLNPGQGIKIEGKMTRQLVMVKQVGFALYEEVTSLICKNSRSDWTSEK